LFVPSPHSFPTRRSSDLLSLNRPDKLNSITEPMAEELHSLLGAAKTSEDVRCIMLTGKGKAFCVGQDLSEVMTKGENYKLGKTVRNRYNPINKAIRKLK